ncbi:Putative MFS transporter superfamily [Septoria linicola]|uniref:MFS transporter superfamily n=1 Tax=Septoria linicola TaxID=215465 RepID=A0A9Q9EL63_9PEZI|nr:putative MFS transporter superfamily [Septoria linicola]USW53999.1 Putative MFS transporter superfamily [Septoria linicola]
MAQNCFQRRSLRVSNATRTSAANLTLRQSLFPLALVTGFSYGLLDALNSHFQKTLGIDRARSAGLQAAYFGAYPLASLGHANWILRHYGYKAVFIWGLVLYGVGFCVSIFVIGNGLGSSETATNPYITVCGPARYAEMRINLSQAFNGIGSVVAPLMGSYIFSKDVSDNTSSLQDVQYVVTIPEITDADLTSEDETANQDQSFWKNYKLFHAAFAQFCYVGSQVAVASFFINYVIETRPNTSRSTAAQFFAGAQGTFAIGRFFGVGLMKYIRPRKVFLVFLSMVVVFTAASIGTKDNAGLTMLYFVLFFESIVFSTIVALGMRGLGKHTKRGSGLIIGGVVGGAVVPPILGAISDVPDSGTAYAFGVPLVFFILSWTYPFCVNFIAPYRIAADDVGVVSTTQYSGATEDIDDGSSVLAKATIARVEKV